MEKWKKTTVNVSFTVWWNYLSSLYVSMTSGANKKKTDHHGITAKKIIKKMIAQTMIPIFNISFNLKSD